MNNIEAKTATVEDVRGRVDAIRRMANREIDVASDGYPHHGEYCLWRDVLTEIARGSFEPRDLASEAIKTLDIVFDRFF